ncbi:MAG TPA: type I methionyl aminopeptidase, partial [Actinobacteria bacterium]|nr:type I methionyl aminopeptidase [Actinomycetota bacterium]
MIIRKSPAQIDKIARAGEIVAGCLDMLRGKCRPGATTAGLDA